MVPAARPTAAVPSGAKLANRSVWKAVNAITMKPASTPSLMITMMVLALADSEAPRMSSSMHITTRMMAGRLTMPGSASHGAAVIARGRLTLKMFSSSLFRYWLHPTATAAVDTPYSSSRHAATPMATSSPSVVYA